MGIMDRLKRIFSGATAAPVRQIPVQTGTQSAQTLSGLPGNNKPVILEGERLAAQQRAESLVREFNESLNTANTSRSREIRESRLRAARGGLAELKTLVTEYPSLQLQNLQAAESEINRIQKTLGAPALTKTVNTLEEARDNQMEVWHSNSDIVTGLQFCATMQLRTPLRVLLRHGEIYTDTTKSPPKIENETWEGAWTPKTKTYREQGIDIDERLPGEHASAIGPILPEEYLPFLIAVRRIVETHAPIEHRISQLREMLSVCEWQTYVSQHGGVEGMIQYFFPRHIAPMPKLPAGTMGELARLGLDTPTLIAAVPDEVLLGIKGIGPAKLNAIRAHCTDMAKHPDADRVENVCR